METREMLAELIGMQAAALRDDAGAFDETAARLLGINANDLHCLALVTIRGPMTAGDLADAAGLTPGAITTLADRLERAGYAQRRRDDIDRRRVLIEPTPRALEISQRIWGPLAKEGAESLMRFNEAELDAILEFLRLARAVHARHIERVRSMSLDDAEGPATG
jgi:DNA-binding MarR family transcriptional regulator